jgi:hypothetical protein
MLPECEPVVFHGELPKMPEMPSRTKLTTQPLNELPSLRCQNATDQAVTENGIVLRMKPDRRKTDRVVTVSDVARRGYELYLARGGEHGHDLDDWLRAERELRSVKADLRPASHVP